LNAHLSPATLNALADGELSPADLAAANQHLEDCPVCTSTALTQLLLKAAITRAGRRYTPPATLANRLATSERPAPQIHPRARIIPWTGIAAVLLLAAYMLFVPRRPAPAALQADLTTEVFDEHIASLAAGAAPHVVSSDRHTVKPWFQGKLPFSFNLPQNLPPDTTLDGANLTYIHSHPAAQLLYSIGRHHVSIFLLQEGATPEPYSAADRAGFHVTGFTTGTLQAIAIGDVDAPRLAALAAQVQQAQ